MAGIRENVIHMKLGCRKRAVSQNLRRLVCGRQDVCCSDAIALMLARTVVQIVIQCDKAAAKALAVVPTLIQNREAQRHASAPEAGNRFQRLFQTGIWLEGRIERSQKAARFLG